MTAQFGVEWKKNGCDLQASRLKLLVVGSAEARVGGVVSGGREDFCFQITSSFFVGGFDVAYCCSASWSYALK